MTFPKRLRYDFFLNSCSSLLRYVEVVIRNALTYSCLQPQPPQMTSHGWVGHGIKSSLFCYGEIHLLYQNIIVWFSAQTSFISHQGHPSTFPQLSPQKYHFWVAKNGTCLPFWFCFLNIRIRTIQLKHEGWGTTASQDNFEGFNPLTILSGQGHISELIAQHSHFSDDRSS